MPLPRCSGLRLRPLRSANGLRLKRRPIGQLMYLRWGLSRMLQTFSEAFDSDLNVNTFYKNKLKKTPLCSLAFLFLRGDASEEIQKEKETQTFPTTSRKVSFCLFQSFV